MRILAVCLGIIVFSVTAFGQDQVSGVVKNQATKEPVVGATVSAEGREGSAVTGADGRFTLPPMPDGEWILRIFSPGYEPKEIKLTFPRNASQELTILIDVTNEVGDVVVTSTRTGREVAAEPTRVEAIDEEEVDEKISMRPANVSMVLSESTGIKVQQTSATSNTQTVKIQGLDGRYTQILKDGFPAFGGFSGSLSLLEIPPLDLRQVEIIKGPAATLYGEGAIAGVVNFISKEPSEKMSTSMILNATSAAGADFSIFNSAKRGKIGYTLLASANIQKEYDADEDGFSDLPRTRSFALNPRLFVYASDRTRFNVGTSLTFQNRTGGDMFVIDGDESADHRYFETNRSARSVTTFDLSHDLKSGGRFNARQSLAIFSRDLKIPGYSFRGLQVNSYTDVNFARGFGRHGVVLGFSATHDSFDEKRSGLAGPARDESRTVVGGYAQDTFDLTTRISLEAGIRIDHARRYGTFVLPRASALFRINEHLTSRIGFGLGYKTPTIFTEEAETLLFKGVLPPDPNLKAERSTGGTFDLNYEGSIGERFTYSLNQMFFFTQIENALTLRPVSAAYRFENAGSPIISRGFETNARLSYDIAKLFVGYTFTDAKAGYLPGSRRLPLVPRNRINSSLIFEREDSFKGGVEAYYTGSQTLTDRTRTRPFWVMGIYGEKAIGKIRVFFNAENITDVRQSRFGPVVLPPYSDPTFAEVYTHLEGRIFNGGIKIRL